jgi:tetratricopeptide (TPR) repeat protein
MSGEVELRLEKLAARYDLPGQAEWQKLLHHVQLSTGFSLLVLLVLDADGAALCRRELEIQLQKEGKQLFAIEIPTPEDLRRLSSSLLATQPSAKAGCVWIAAVEPDYGKAYPEWREAWQLALARLNSHRNEIRRHFNLPLMFVGAPWLQEVMREIAPDLWSVRTLVVRIEPRPQSTSAQLTSERAGFGFEIEKSGADPDFALKEAEVLRGVPGKELALARLLLRAGEGFASRHDWPSARKAYVEALELNQRAQAAPDALMVNLNQLAVACASTGNYRESISYLETALTMARQIRDRKLECIMLGILSSSHSNLGNMQKALEYAEQSLVVAREVGDRRIEANNLIILGDVKGISGDFRKSIELYEQASLIAREIGDRITEGASLGGLGSAYGSLGDIHKAIEMQEQALVIAHEIGDQWAEVNGLGGRGVSYLRLGEWNKAIEYFEKALPISREIGAKLSEGLLLSNSSLALARLGKRPEAIARAEESLQILKAIESPVAAKVEAQLAAWKGEVK